MFDRGVIFDELCLKVWKSFATKFDRCVIFDEFSSKVWNASARMFKKGVIFDELGLNYFFLMFDRGTIWDVLS